MVCVLVSKFEKLNANICESQILCFLKHEKLAFLAYSVRRERFLEIREFQRVRIDVKPLIYGHLGLKKALLKSANFRNSSNE